MAQKTGGMIERAFGLRTVCGISIASSRFNSSAMRWGRLVVLCMSSYQPSAISYSAHHTS
jgi:hypothetical protein